MCIRRSEDFGTSYVRLIYVLCLRGSECFFSNLIFLESLELQWLVPVSEMCLWLVVFKLFGKMWCRFMKHLFWGVYTKIRIAHFLQVLQHTRYPAILSAPRVFRRANISFLFFLSNTLRKVPIVSLFLKIYFGIHVTLKPKLMKKVKLWIFPYKFR